MHARMITTRILLALLVVGGAALFMVPFGKDGKPLLRWSEFAAPALEALKATGLDIPGLEGLQGERTVTVYRWRDADGVWHYGETPPAGAHAEAVTVDPDVNLLPGLAKERPSGPTLSESLADIDPADYLEGTRRVKKAVAAHEERQGEAIDAVK